MSKLQWEWQNYDRNEIRIRKARGKITMQELVDFMHEPEQVNLFIGKLVLFMFRVNPDADMFDYGYEESAGDEQTLMILEDEGHCPICNGELFVQYCPECGHQLYGSGGSDHG